VPRGRIGAGDRVTVVGLGRFGRAVARTCHELGYEVIAIDPIEELVQGAESYAMLPVQGDGSDEQMMRALGVGDSMVGIVALGSNIEASVLATLTLKELGVKRVIAKASSEQHRKLLVRLGADRVVFPERDSGRHLAHSLAVPSIDSYITLTATTGVAKIDVPQRMIGRTLSDLLKESKANVSVLLLMRGSHLIATPSFQERVAIGDVLVIAGPDEDMEVFVEATRDGGKA
jgi:trk system potassium uptake protein